MDDRELLELAARAAGVPGVWIESCPEDGCPTYSCGIGSRGRITVLWNPLTNDGDALRLAAKLRISIMHAANHVACDLPNDDYAFEEAATTESTRRAIVRAAAEIGRSMP